MKNFAFTTGKALPSVNSGHVFEGYNFCQLKPRTRIFGGISGLVFIKCNLLNCEVPPDAVMEDCLHVHKSFCSNLHSEFVDYGLPQCPDNCSHVVDTDEIWIDGVLIDTVYSYKDTLV